MDPRQGIMRAPEGLSDSDVQELEKWALEVGLSPLFDSRPQHHGQHSWCCENCNKFRAVEHKHLDPVRQPWEAKIVEAVPTFGPPPKAFNRGFWNDIRYEGSYTYFIQDVERTSDPVKIGMARDPDGRLAALQTGHPRPLKLLAIVPGGRPLERTLHEVFKNARSHGEWFAGPSVPVIRALAVELRDSMLAESDKTGEIPAIPTLHMLTNMAAQVRRELASEQQLAA